MWSGAERERDAERGTLGLYEFCVYIRGCFIYAISVRHVHVISYPLDVEG